MGVRMWANKNLDCFYHYREYDNLEFNDLPRLEDDLFCLAIQMKWQLEMMVWHAQVGTIRECYIFNKQAQGKYVNHLN